MVSVSDFGTRGQGSIGHLLQIVFLYLLFLSLLMQHYFIKVIWNYKMTKKLHALTFYNELSSK